MDEQRMTPGVSTLVADELKGLMKSVIQEYMNAEKTRSEPAYKTELVEEKKRREQLERRVNELVEENARSRQAAEESDRNAQIKSELTRLGVAKVELAFKVVKDEIQRATDGTLQAGERDFKQYLTEFVQQNPEFLPARIAGGSGAVSAPKPAVAGIDLEKIQPGMSPEELRRIREQISEVAAASLRGE